MKELLYQYECIENQVRPHMRGHLTADNLIEFLDKIRNIAEQAVAQIPKADQEIIIKQVQDYILPKDLNTALTIRIIVECFALRVLLDEYLMNVGFVPGLKALLWSELEKDGINFAVFSGIDDAIIKSEKDFS